MLHSSPKGDGQTPTSALRPKCKCMKEPHLKQPESEDGPRESEYVHVWIPIGAVSMGLRQMSHMSSESESARVAHYLLTLVMS